VTLASLRILAGPEPETPDQQRARRIERERIEGAFPQIGVEEPGAVISRRSNRLR
jgi:hypothetical protein